MGGGDSTVFAGYQVFGPVAAGGMASVHLARREDAPDTYLALKRLHPHLLAREDVRRMFLNEAGILSNLSHPNICPITDYGIHDEAPYLVMQYLHGAPLSGLLRRLLDLGRPLPIDLMCYVIASTCEGLHYAHDAVGADGQPLALVHRDISPQNIFVTFNGAVKLLDFGVAKAAGYENFTRTGHIKGKYAYMSPEQASGDDLDRRSDVFSLGIVLWESLTGRHLFKRKRELETLHAISAGVVPPPSQINPGVSADLDRILKRTLQPRAPRRYQTAAALAEQLWSYLMGRPHPMGADEVAEILAEVFADHPSPAEQAHRMLTQPDAQPLPTSASKLPLEDLEPSVIEEATQAAQRALDAETDEPDISSVLEAPTGEVAMRDPDVTPRDGAHVAPSAADTGDLRVPTEIVGDADPTGPNDVRAPLERAETKADDDLDLLTNVSPDHDVPELIPWHADQANQAPTIADPNLSEEVRRAVEALASAPEPDEAEPPSRSFLDRPVVAPHPFDHGEGFEAEAQETLTDDRPPRAAKGVTTVPKDEISDIPPELPGDGPRIATPPPSLIDDPRPMPSRPAPAEGGGLPVLPIAVGLAVLGGLLAWLAVS